MMLEKQAILQALRDTGAVVTDQAVTGGNIGRAARKLGVARRTLQDRMRFYGIPAGKAGRRKKKMSYGRHAKSYAIGAAAVALAAGAVILQKKKVV